MVVILDQYNLADFLVFGILSFIFGLFSQLYYKEALQLLQCFAKIGLAFIEFCILALIWIFSLMRGFFIWLMKCSVLIIEFSRYSLEDQRTAMQELEYYRDSATATLKEKFRENSSCFETPHLENPQNPHQSLQSNEGPFDSPAELHGGNFKDDFSHDMPKFPSRASKKSSYKSGRYSTSNNDCGPNSKHRSGSIKSLADVKFSPESKISNKKFVSCPDA
jgi:hypothetical protein